MEETKTAREETRAERRGQVIERFTRKLDKYLPEEGELRKWTLAEIETDLSQDVNEIARDIVEARIDFDPHRVPEKRPACPKCGRPARSLDRERSAHRITVFGRLEYGRSYGFCHACGVAFSPSGQCLGLRQGLL